MYQLKIQNTVELEKTIIIADGEQYLDIDSNPIEKESYDQNGDLILDGNGDPVMEPFLNNTGEDQEVGVNKTAQEIAEEEQALKDAKAAEIQAKIDVYEAAKENQRQNGGPGPVADFEIMKICNEHDGQFEVIFEEG